MRKSCLLPMLAGLFLAGCVTVPTGPNVMVLPGNGKEFEQFKIDDALCRQWAVQQTGIAPNRAAAASAASGAAIGTVLGAGSGAAIGAASGSPATGAAVGAGAGLLGGTLLGADVADTARWTVQQRYDVAYMQCMYAKGNQIPVRGAPQPASTQAQPSTGEQQKGAQPENVPPPPRGTPPLPPRGPSR